MLDRLLFPTLDDGTAQQRAEWIVEAQHPFVIVRIEDPTRIPSSYADIVWEALGVYGSSGSTGATPQITKAHFQSSEMSPGATTVHPTTRLRA